MYKFKKITEYSSGILAIVLEIVLFNHYSQTIDFIESTQNINMIWIVFVLCFIWFFRFFCIIVYRFCINIYYRFLCDKIPNIIEKILFTDNLKLYFYKLKLHIRRCVRRFVFLKKASMPTFWLIPLWGAFIVILIILTHKSFWELIDECKFTLFSSIVVTCAISVRDAYYRNKDILNEQFEIYIWLMYSLENTISKVVKQNYPHYTDAYCSNWCYTDNRFRGIQTYIVSGKKMLPTVTLYNELEELKKVLEKAKKLIAVDRIITNEERILSYINDVLKRIDTIKNTEQCDKRELGDFCCDVYWLVLNHIRFPWRRDIDLDIKINKILLKKQQEKGKDKIKVNYYKHLLVDEDFDTTYPQHVVKVRKTKSIPKH